MSALSNQRHSSQGFSPHSPCYDTASAGWRFWSQDYCPWQQQPWNTAARKNHQLLQQFVQRALLNRFSAEEWSIKISLRLHQTAWRTRNLRPVYICDFSCDFDAILSTKPAPAYPARVFSRVTLRQNTAKLAEIEKRGVLKKTCDNFLSNPRDASRKKHSCRVE